MNPRILKAFEVRKLLPMAMAFAAEANYPGGLNEEIFVKSWTALITSGTGRIHVMEVDGKLIGALGMGFFSDPFSGVSVAAETFWFVDKDHRNSRAGIHLFNAFEQSAKEAGSKKLVFVHLANIMPERLHAFYASRGYSLVEQTFSKNA